MIRHMIFWKLADPQADRAALEDFLRETFCPHGGGRPGPAGRQRGL